MTHADKEMYWNLIWTMWVMHLLSKVDDEKISIHIQGLVDEHYV